MMKGTRKVQMKMSMKDITVAACGAFAAIVIGINWLVPINAFAGAPTQQPLSPYEKLVQHMTNSFTAWNIANNNLAEDLQDFAKASHDLENENAQLKDELAKAKAPPPPAPTPMSTPAPKP